jgi:hypothetical protein
MNRDDVIKMAQDSGMFYCDFIEEFVSDYSNAVSLEHIERFFHMAQAAEREACAKVCESYTDKSDADHESHGYACAAAIRARGQE